VILTDEGAVIYFDYRGYGRKHPLDDGKSWRPPHT
jgi:hypothetical protein